MRARSSVTGNPIRSQLLAGQPATAVKALDWDGWEPCLPTVYVTGGAQGSAQVNRLVAAVLDKLLPQANVVHQYGSGALAELRRHAERLPADLARRYRVASRSGAYHTAPIAAGHRRSPEPPVHGHARVSHVLRALPGAPTACTRSGRLSELVFSVRTGIEMHQRVQGGVR